MTPHSSVWARAGVTAEPGHQLLLVLLLFTLGCHDHPARAVADAASPSDAAAEDAAVSLAADSLDAVRVATPDLPIADLPGAGGSDTSSDRRLGPEAMADTPAVLPPLSDAGVVVTPAEEVALAVWGSGPDDVWIGGKGGMLRHWDGVVWTDHSFFPSTCLVVAIWGASATSVWAAGCTNTVAFWNGSTWQEQPTPAGSRLLETLRGSAVDDVWVGGCSQLLLHWDGKAWTEPGGAPAGCIEGFWFRSRTDGWRVSRAGSASSVDRWDGRQWSGVDMVGIGEGRPTAVFGMASDDVWVASWEGLYHFDGTRWAIPSAGKDIPNSRGSLFALWGRSATELFAGGSKAWRFDENGWSPVTLAPGTVRGIWGAPTGQAWFVGDNGFLGGVP